MKIEHGRLGQVAWAMLVAALFVAGCAADTGNNGSGVVSGGTSGAAGAAGDAGGTPNGGAGGAVAGTGGAVAGTGGSDPGTGGADAGTAGSDAGSGATGGGSGGTGGAAGGGLAGSAPNPLEDGGIECFAEGVDPEPVQIEVEVQVPIDVPVPQPLAIYIMLDKSLSMNDPTVPGGSTSKWSSAVSSINDFVQDPDSQHMEVALQYFPIGGAQCNGSGYDTPAVPMGPLPGNATSISSSLDGTQPSDFTPFEGALRGVTSFCAQFQTQTEGVPCIAVLVSDGEPTQCVGSDLNFGPLAAIADDAYSNSNVRTFTVGMEGASLPLLEQVAQFGGTDCTDGKASDTDGLFACDLRSGMTLLEALEAIREWMTRIDFETQYRPDIQLQLSKCDWGIPEPPEGETFDKTMVNVQFTEPGMDPVNIGKAPSEAGCSQVQDGWYYDNEDNPTTIIACPQTCEYITSVVDGRIDIQFGCETKLAPLE